MNEAQKKQKRKEIKAELLQIKLEKKEFKDNNLIYFFNAPDSGLRANPPQSELLEAWDNPRYKVFTYTGGNRTGKTTIASILAVSTIIGSYPWDNRKLHFTHSLPRKVRIVGQGWEDHIAKVVIPELKKWWPKNRPVKTKKNNQGVEHLWTDQKTGGTIEIMSNNQDSEQFEGAQLDLIYYDEPPKRDVRVANARGLVDRLGREIVAATLLKEAWLHQEVIQAVDDDGRPDMTVFNVTAVIYDNVGYGITIEGVEQFEKTLTEDEKDARLRGIPSYMSGLVLPQWKRNKHVVKRFKVPLNWMVDVLIDVHPRERQAILFIATAENGHRYLVNEIWDHGDGRWIAENIIRCASQNNYRINRVAIDPLAKGDSNQDHSTYEKIATILARHDMGLEVASKDKDNGILLIKEHLEGPNGEPSLFVFDDLVVTIKEIEGWLWDEKTQKAKKVDDHFPENLYRALLLDTKYYEPEDEEDDSIYHSDHRNAITGY